MTAYQNTFARVELKYLLDKDQYLAFRERTSDLAAEDAYGWTQILNIYYGTPDYRLVRASLDRPVYKEKLRLRTYGTPENASPAFVELKKKYRGIVYKRRTQLPYLEARRFVEHGLLSHGPDQIEREIFWCLAYYRELVPAMVLSYRRLALAGREAPALRITFDTKLQWRSKPTDLRLGPGGADLLAPDKVLMEIKVGGGMPLPLVSTLSDLKIRPVSYSKYGRAYRQLVKEKRTAPCTAASCSL
ncbi:MAG: polyphosphate polymerase domain-containing protein [Firmicutes bacterium]|nr:polyphosphate polymerase domain-containing protein [Bacillota bacterium]